MWVVTLRGVPRGVGLAHGMAIASELLLFGELNAVTVYDEAAVCYKAVRGARVTLMSDVQMLSRREMQNETMKPIRL